MSTISQKGITVMSESSKPSATPLLNPETFAPYFERLTEQQVELSSALKEGHARTQRIGSEVVDLFLNGQKDLLDLTRQITLKPQDYAANMKAMVDATTVAQERAMSFAKLLYREQSDVAGEWRKWFQESVQSSGNVTDFGRQVMNFWTKQQ